MRWTEKSSVLSKNRKYWCARRDSNPLGPSAARAGVNWKSGPATSRSDVVCARRDSNAGPPA